MNRLLAVSVAGFLALVAAPGAQAQELRPAEKIYADIAGLKGAAREATLIEGAKREGALRVVSTLRGELTRDELAMFQKRYPFLKVEMSESGSQDAAERLLTEETAGRHLTDVIEIAIADMRELQARNLQARYPTPATDAILPQNRASIDPQSRWTPFSVSEFGIVYNTNLLKPEDAPKSWDDLCDAKYSGTISFDPAEVRFLYGLYVMMGDAKMQQWMECIGKNKPIIQRGHTQRLQLMLAGDHMLSPDQYFYMGVGLKWRENRTPFGMVTSAPILTSFLCAVINPNTPHPYAAALFADWHLSDEFQDYLAKAPRGPITRPSPYVPTDAKLVVYGYGTDAEYAKVLDYWKKYMPR